MSCKLECLQERSQFDLVCLRRGEPQILLDCAPGQQARLLKHHTKPSAGRKNYLALKIAIKSRNYPQQRGLAASGRPNERRDLSDRKFELDFIEYLESSSGRRLIELLLNADFKLRAGASGRYVFQVAGPETFPL